MLPLGLSEIAIIAVIALIAVGPERLPRLFREMGKWYGQARRAADELRRAFVLEADRQDAAERYAKLQERRRQAEEARRARQAKSEAEPEDPAAATGTVAQSSEVFVPEVVEGEEDEGAVDANAEPPDAPHPTRPTPPPRPTSEDHAGGVEP